MKDENTNDDSAGAPARSPASFADAGIEPLPNNSRDTK